MNKEEIEAAIGAGQYYPLPSKKDEEGNSRPEGLIKDMPLVFREMFSRSIKRTLAEAEVPKDKDWSVQVTDDQEPGPLKYQFHCFHVDSVAEYMVMCRVGTYDMVKKEVLPDDQDRIIVFKFKSVDDLL